MNENVYVFAYREVPMKLRSVQSTINNQVLYMLVDLN